MGQGVCSWAAVQALEGRGSWPKGGGRSEARGGDASLLGTPRQGGEVVARSPPAPCPRRQGCLPKNAEPDKKGAGSRWSRVEPGEGRGEEEKREGRKKKEGDVAGSRRNSCSRCSACPDSLDDGALGEHQQAEQQQPLHGSGGSQSPEKGRSVEVCRSRQELALIYSPSPWGSASSASSSPLILTPNRKVPDKTVPAPELRSEKFPVE